MSSPHSSSWAVEHPQLLCQHSAMHVSNYSSFLHTVRAYGADLCSILISLVLHSSLNADEARGRKTPCQVVYPSSFFFFYLLPKWIRKLLPSTINHPHQPPGTWRMAALCDSIHCGAARGLYHNVIQKQPYSFSSLHASLETGTTITKAAHLIFIIALMNPLYSSSALLLMIFAVFPVLASIFALLCG